jgi:hypothetical protein
VAMVRRNAVREMLERAIFVGALAGSEGRMIVRDGVAPRLDGPVAQFKKMSGRFKVSRKAELLRESRPTSNTKS